MRPITKTLVTLVSLATAALPGKVLRGPGYAP